jgi:hypothetical protein
MCDCGSGGETRYSEEGTAGGDIREFTSLTVKKFLRGIVFVHVGGGRAEAFSAMFTPLAGRRTVTPGGVKVGQSDDPQGYCPTCALFLIRMSAHRAHAEPGTGTWGEPCVPCRLRQPWTDERIEMDTLVRTAVSTRAAGVRACVLDLRPRHSHALLAAAFHPAARQPEHVLPGAAGSPSHHPAPGGPVPRGPLRATRASSFV